MTFLFLVHPDPPTCYGRCAWKVLYLSTNVIPDDNKAPVCPSPPFGTYEEALAAATCVSFASASA
eukprot:10293842-Ditylum_brightwellii.AAC.1